MYSRNTSVVNMKRTRKPFDYSPKYSLWRFSSKTPTKLFQKRKEKRVSVKTTLQEKNSYDCTFAKF